MGEPQVVEAESFPDRTAWMIAFGIFQVVMALLGLALAVGIMVVPIPASAGSGRLSAAVLAVWGAAVLAAGIGSILRKDWARTASIVLSAFWLFAGVCGLAVMLVVFPGITARQPSTSPEQVRLMFGVMVGVGIVLLLLPPAVLLFFYSRKSVRATCLAGSPQPHGGLHRPAAIVALAGWLTIGTLGGLPGLFHPVVFLFGTVVRGPAAAAVTLANVAICAGAAWGVWRQRIQGWWAALLLSVFWGLSGAISFMRWDVWSMSRELGYEQAPPAVPFDRAAFSQFVRVSLLVLAAVFIALVLYARRYFVSTRPGTRPPPSGI